MGIEACAKYREEISLYECAVVKARVVLNNGHSQDSLVL